MKVVSSDSFIDQEIESDQRKLIVVFNRHT
jgi:hypothetical protein